MRLKIIGIAGLVGALLLIGFSTAEAATTASAADSALPNSASISTDIIAAASGNYHQIVNKAYDQCVDVPNSSTSRGVQLQIWSCNGTGAQAWAPVLASGNIYYMVNQNSGLCVEVRNSSLLLGKPIQQWPCVGVAGQQWVRTPVFVDGAVWETFRNVNSGLCLDTVGGAFSLLMQWTCQGNDAQYWQVR